MLEHVISALVTLAFLFFLSVLQLFTLILDRITNLLRVPKSRQATGECVVGQITPEQVCSLVSLAQIFTRFQLSYSVLCQNDLGLQTQKLGLPLPIQI